MIKRAVRTDKNYILEILDKNEAINSPIIAQIERYGFEKDFQDIWLYKKKSDFNTVILRHFNQMYIYEVIEDTDYEEIASFSSFLDARIIWSERGTLIRLIEFLHTFHLEPSFHMILKDVNSLTAFAGVENAVPEDCSELAGMIYNDAEFKRFYSSEDEIRQGIKRRIELGQCRYKIIRNDGIIMAQAYTTLETNNYSIIGGVITHQDYRNKGFATKVVSALSRDILCGGKTPNLFYKTVEAGILYSRLGFQPAGEYGMLISI